MTDAVDDDPSDARRARDRGARWTRSSRRTRQARRPAARRRDRDQGPVRHLRHAHDLGRRRVLGERPPAGRRHVRPATARRRRDHPRQGQHGRVRAAAHGAQLVRRHDLQRLRHRARPGRLERRLGASRWPRTSSPARSARRPAPRSRAGAKDNNIVGLAPTRELVSARRHDPARPQHPRRSDLPDRGGHGQDPRRLRRLRPEGRADGVQHAAASRSRPYDRRTRGAGGSTASASASSASTWTRRCSRTPTSRAIDIVDRGDRRPARARRDDRRPGPGRRAVPELRRPLRAEVAQPAVHRRSSRRCSRRRAGEPTTDHIATLLDMFFDPTLVPHTATGRPSIRNLGGTRSDTGDGRYNFNAYIRERGDANIKTLTDLITKANFWTDPVLAEPQVQPGEHRRAADAGDRERAADPLRAADGRLRSASPSWTSTRSSTRRATSRRRS